MTQEQIDSIKSQTYLPDIVAENVILRRSGTGYVGCCPFHGDKSPSFHLYAPDTDHNYWRYKCFGCDKSGDCFQYLIERDGISFNEAGKILADKLNVQVDDKPRRRNRNVEQPQPKNPYILALSKPDENGNIVFLPTKIKSADSDFCKWLLTKFKPEQVQKVVDDYCLGITRDKHVIFWRIDEHGFVRSGKIMKYAADGHRMRNGERDITDWIHARYKNALIRSSNTDESIKDTFRRMGSANPVAAIRWDSTLGKWVDSQWKLTQTLFGLHLLHDAPKSKGVCIVESEKTAVVMSIIMPQFVWLSCGGASMLDICLTNSHDALAGRRVLIFPDKEKDGKNFYMMWQEVCRRHPSLNLSVSDVLEHDTELQPGDDIADLYLADGSKPTVQKVEQPQQEPVKATASLEVVTHGDVPYYKRFKHYPSYYTIQNAICDDKYNTLIDYKDPAQVFAKIDWMHNYPAWKKEEWVDHYKRMVRTEDIPNADTAFWNCLELFEYADRDKGLIRFVG